MAVSVPASHGEEVVRLINDALELAQNGHTKRALKLAKRAIKLRPDMAETHFALAVPLKQMGDWAGAEREYRATVNLNQQHWPAYDNLGNIFLDQGRPGHAEVLFRKALELNGGHALSWNNLGGALSQLGQLDEAARCFRESIRMKPDFAQAHSNLGSALGALGEHDLAMAMFRQAMALDPGAPNYHSNLIFTQDLAWGVSKEESYAERKAWALRHGNAAAAGQGDRRGSAREGVAESREGALRIGYVSADFRNHSAMHAFAPVILSHDRDKFDAYAYSGGVSEDDVGLLVREGAHWRETAFLSDNDLARRIRDDGIEILVDLSGHSAGNRLTMFAQRVAPIQVHAWGYVNGTGLPTMDYILADPVTAPLSEQPYYAEKIVHLPNTISYWPLEQSPPITTPPCLKNGYVTFGVMNRPMKVTQRILEAWAEILARVPEARIVFKHKGYAEDAWRRRIERAFLGYNVSPTRVGFRGETGQFEHFAAYNEVDIALDPAPHGGGITTCEALWMGVPVLTLKANRMPGRISASILHTLGLLEWVAYSVPHYVGLAQGYAENTAYLATLRGELRERLAGSILCNHYAYCRAVEDAYLRMWGQYVAVQS